MQFLRDKETWAHFADNYCHEFGRVTVDQMNPNGNANVTIGLVWAWHELTANLPFAQAAAPDPNLDKVIILLTDAQNTRNRWTFLSTFIDERTQIGVGQY